MTALEWQTFADASVEHRDPHDADVELVVHVAQEWAEISILDHQHRLVSR